MDKRRKTGFHRGCKGRLVDGEVRRGAEGLRGTYPQTLINKGLPRDLTMTPTFCYTISTGRTAEKKLPGTVETLSASPLDNGSHFLL